VSGLFPRGSVIHRVNIEPVVFLGAGRALLLQLASPVVAQGVHDHSEFKRNPFKRLQGTLEATYAVVFGPEELARSVGRRIQWIHDHVTGPGYRANDPEHLMWVHATLLDTALGCYLDYVGPLADRDAETYYRQMTEVAEVFGVPAADQPASLAEFRAYFDRTVGALRVSEVGRDLAQFILDPTLPLGLHVPLGPLLRLQKLVTIGALPAPIRDQFGLALTESDERRLRRLRRRVRRVVRVTPPVVRTAGNRALGVYLLWLARRHAQRFEERLAPREHPAA
jgi:uncharacterized protein (DUF2236 family)